MFIKNREELLARGKREARELALEMVEAGLAAVDPYANTKALIRVEGNRLLVGGQPEADVSGFGEEVIDLSQVRHIYIVGAGKAVQMQAKALEDTLGDRLTAGAVTVKEGEKPVLERVEVYAGEHPVPGEGSVAGARRIVALAREAGENDLVFTLFSSGASSLFVLPAPGFTLADVQAVYRLAIRYGHQTIIHRVMPYFSAVNQGRIITLAAPARTINLLSALDQVPRWRGRLHTGGSWLPSWLPGPRRMAQAAAELRAEPWWAELPAGMRAVLERGDERYEVPSLEDFCRLTFSYWQPSNSHHMLEAAAKRARAAGWRSVILGSWFWAPGDAVAQVLAGVAREVAEHGNPAPAPVALISGGELTVPVGTATGIGGRNQEFALSTALQLNAATRGRTVVAAVDSDGTDGPGIQLRDDPALDLDCLAGGLVDETTLADAAREGIDLAAELRNHNSSLPLLKLGGGIRTGNTGICAGDLRLVLVLPEDGGAVRRKTMSDAKIVAVRAREILNGIGDPTVEVDVLLSDGSLGRASVPSGTSTGRYEAHELRDGGERYGGRGVLRAVENVRDLMAPVLQGMDAANQREVDERMLLLDGTPDKSRLGANATLAVSLAVADAAARSAGLPLYRYLGAPADASLPLPMANVMAGGPLSGNALDYEDHLIFPVVDMSAAEATRGNVEIYRQVGRLLEERCGPVRVVGGAYAPPLTSEDEALALIRQAIEDAGYGGRFGLGLDVAASGLYDAATNTYRLAGRALRADDLIDHYARLVAKHGITMIEDPFAEDDLESFRRLTERLDLTVVGDDLFVTNRERLQRGISARAANAVLFKINQVGTLSEALDTARLAREAGYMIVASARSGDCEDTAMVDVAVAVGARYAKFGAPARGERTIKYNRLLRIEEEITTGHRVQ